MEFFKQIYKINAAGKTAEEFINELTSKVDGLKGRTFKELLGSFYVAAFSQEKTGVYKLLWRSSNSTKDYKLPCLYGRKWTIYYIRNQQVQ